MKELYEKVKDYAKSKGLDVNALAKAVGQTPHGLRTGLQNRKTKMDTIGILAETLEVSVSFFYEEGTGQNATTNSNSQKEINKLQSEIKLLKDRIAELKQEKNQQYHDLQKTIGLLEQNNRLSLMQIPTMKGIDPENKEAGKMVEVANGSNINLISIVGNPKVGTA